MKVKEWIEELKCYDEDAEVVFDLSDDIPCDSWTEDKYGNKSVNVNSLRLEETFVCDLFGDCRIELGVANDE